MDEQQIYMVWLDGFLAGQASKGMEPDPDKGREVFAEVTNEMAKNEGRCPICSNLQTEEYKPYCSENCEIIDNLLM